MPLSQATIEKVAEAILWAGAHWNPRDIKAESTAAIQAMLRSHEIVNLINIAQVIHDSDGRIPMGGEFHKTLGAILKPFQSDGE